MKKNSTRPSHPKARSPERNRNENIQVIFGLYQKKGSKEYVVVGNQNYLVSEIKKSIEKPIKHNAKVKALIKKHKGEETVKILRLLAPELSLAQKIERILIDAQVPVLFSQIIHDEANLFGDKVSESDKKTRTDLRDLALCTIDGETAKDFDDAVFAQRKGKNIEVIVAIADVSHYVKIGSALDEEAFLRGTSIYYPGHCVPMLPEQLSNGLCSLKPNVDRLALSVSFELGPKGRISNVRLNDALIKSKARLTYNQVQAFYDKKAKAERIIPEDVQESLIELKNAAHILRRVRENRGAIDFDILESVIALDENGEPLSVNPLSRLESHRIIEDLMVAANETVAEFFDRKKIPSIYRVHEAPNEEKLENFFKTALAFGVLKEGVKAKAASITDPKALQTVMGSYANSQYKETLGTLMLRAMMQARYSEKNLMHFGLASEAYLHFTSPIRRYADLVVHRQLRYMLFEKNRKKQIPENMMATIAESISQKEVKATELERKINRLFSATFMAGHVGEIFDAVIVSCTEFGFFVRVIEHHVEGLVHISTIAKTHVNYVPERMSLVVSGSNRVLMVGQKVSVRLVNVNADRGHIDFELAEEEIDEPTRRAGKGRMIENVLTPPRASTRKPAGTKRADNRTSRNIK